MLRDVVAVLWYSSAFCHAPLFSATPARFYVPLHVCLLSKRGEVSMVVKLCRPADRHGRCFATPLEDSLLEAVANTFEQQF